MPVYKLTNKAGKWRKMSDAQLKAIDERKREMWRKFFEKFAP